MMDTWWSGTNFTLQYWAPCTALQRELFLTTRFFYKLTIWSCLCFWFLTRHKDFPMRRRPFSVKNFDTWFLCILSKSTGKTKLGLAISALMDKTTWSHLDRLKKWETSRGMMKSMWSLTFGKEQAHAPGQAGQQLATQWFHTKKA